jgi:hypothetical protein
MAFAIARSRHADSTLGRASVEQLMTSQYYFETVEIEGENNHPARVQTLLAKRQAQNEVRKQKEIEVKRRTATQLGMMIASIERDIANLDVSINSELEVARVRKPFAYPIAARTMQARRENLKATVAALSDRLGLTDIVLVP